MKRELRTLERGLSRLLAVDVPKDEFDGLAGMLYGSLCRRASLDDMLSDTDEWYRSQLGLQLSPRIRAEIAHLLTEWTAVHHCESSTRDRDSPGTERGE